MRLATDINQKLFEVATNRTRLEEVIADSEKRLAYLRKLADDESSTLNTTRLGRRLQRHGRYLALADDHRAAIEAKDEAIEIWERHDRRRAHFLCRLQRASIRCRAGEPDRARSAVEQLAEEIDETTGVYIDIVDETLARCWHALGDGHRALEYLEAALAVRIERGNRNHIDQTRRMMATVCRCHPELDDEFVSPDSTA